MIRIYGDSDWTDGCHGVSQCLFISGWDESVITDPGDNWTSVVETGLSILMKPDPKNTFRLTESQENISKLIQIDQEHSPLKYRSKCQSSPTLYGSRNHRRSPSRLHCSHMCHTTWNSPPAAARWGTSTAPSSWTSVLQWRL